MGARKSHLDQIQWADGIVLDRGRPSALHVQLSSTMRRLIESKFKDGDRFYTERYLSDFLKISPATVRRALGDLVSDGLLVKRGARGTFVSKPVPKAGEAATSTVDLVMPDFTSGFNGYMLEHFSRESLRRGQRIALHHTHRGESLLEIFRRFRESSQNRRVLIVGEPGVVAAELAEFLLRQNNRVVVVDSLSVGLLAPYVGPDNAMGMRLAIEHLAALGHRRIGMCVGQPEQHENIRQRIAAFEELARTFALEATPVAIAGANHLQRLDTERLTSRIDGLLTQPDRPTAIVCDSDPVAAVILQRALVHGLRIPDDFSLVGFNDEPFTEFLSPRLTSVGPDMELLARTAMDMLDRETNALTRAYIPCRLEARDSTSALLR